MSFQDQMEVTHAISVRNYDAAITACKRILNDNKDDAFANSTLAICYEWKGESELAIMYADNVLARFPNDLDMLLVAARYWSEIDDDRAYPFVCRTLENEARTTSGVPTWLLWLMKPLSIFGRFRGIEEKARNDMQAHGKYKEEQLAWAREYKTWYELQKASE